MDPLHTYLTLSALAGLALAVALELWRERRQERGLPHAVTRGFRSW